MPTVQGDLRPQSGQQVEEDAETDREYSQKQAGGPKCSHLGSSDPYRGHKGRQGAGCNRSQDHEKADECTGSDRKPTLGSREVRGQLGRGRSSRASMQGPIVGSIRTRGSFR